MMNHRIISDDGLKAVGQGCTIDIRLPWYRTLPLSVVEVLEVTIDGGSIPLDGVELSLEGETFSLDGLERRTCDMWYVLDSAYLKIPSAPVVAGDEHDLSITLAIYPPYIKGYKRITRTDKRLTAR